MLPEFRRFAGAAGASKKAWPLGRVNARSVVYQALLAAAVGLAAWYLIANAVENVLARRIASVLKHTMLAPDANGPRLNPEVALVTRKAADTAASLLARVRPAPVAAE